MYFPTKKGKIIFVIPSRHLSVELDIHFIHSSSYNVVKFSLKFIRVRMALHLFISIIYLFLTLGDLSQRPRALQILITEQDFYMMMSFDYIYQNAFRYNLCYADLSRTSDTEYNQLASKHSGSCSQMTSSCKCLQASFTIMRSS